MANTQTYLNHLLQSVGITPACSEEERAAAEEIAHIFSRHGFDPEIQEFTSSSSPKLVRAILCVVLFIATVLMGVGGALGIVGTLLVIACCVLYLLERTGRIAFPQIGSGGLSQNVIAYHKAAGPLASPRNRPVVVVAHYDSPRADFLASQPFASYRPILVKLMPIAVAVPAVVAIVRVLPLPDMAKILLWVLAILVSLVPLVNAVAVLLNRYVLPYTSGSVCNKSSVAAMLGVMDAVSPSRTANEFPDDIPFRDYMAEQRRLYAEAAYAAGAEAGDAPVIERGEGAYVMAPEDAAEETEGVEGAYADVYAYGEQDVPAQENTLEVLPGAESAPDADEIDRSVPLEGATIAMPALTTDQIETEQSVPAEVTTAFTVVDGEGGAFAGTADETVAAAEPEVPAAEVEEEPEDELPVNDAGCIRYGVDALRSLGMVAETCAIEYEEGALPRPKPKAVLDPALLAAQNRPAAPEAQPQVQAAPAPQPAHEVHAIADVPVVTPEAPQAAAPVETPAPAMPQQTVAYPAQQAVYQASQAAQPVQPTPMPPAVEVPATQQFPLTDEPAFEADEQNTPVADPFAYNGYNPDEDEDVAESEAADQETAAYAPAYDDAYGEAYDDEAYEDESYGMFEMIEDFEEILPEELDDEAIADLDDPIEASYEVEDGVDEDADDVDAELMDDAAEDETYVAADDDESYDDELDVSELEDGDEIEAAAFESVDADEDIDADAEGEELEDDAEYEEFVEDEQLVEDVEAADEEEADGELELTDEDEAHAEEADESGDADAWEAYQAEAAAVDAFEIDDELADEDVEEAEAVEHTQAWSMETAEVEDDMPAGDTVVFNRDDLAFDEGGSEATSDELIDADVSVVADENAFDAEAWQAAEEPVQEDVPFDEDAYAAEHFDFVPDPDELQHVADFEGIDVEGMGVMEALYEELPDEPEETFESVEDEGEPVPADADEVTPEDAEPMDAPVEDDVTETAEPEVLDASEEPAPTEFVADNDWDMAALDHTIEFNASALAADAESESVDAVAAEPAAEVEPVAEEPASEPSLDSEDLTLFQSIVDSALEDVVPEAPAMAEQPAAAEVAHEAPVVTENPAPASAPASRPAVSSSLQQKVPQVPLTGSTQLFNVAAAMGHTQPMPAQNVQRTAPAAPAPAPRPTETVDSLMAEISASHRPRPQRSIHVPDITANPAPAAPAQAAHPAASNRSALLDLPDPSSANDPFVSDGASGSAQASASNPQFTVVSPRDASTPAAPAAGTFETIKAPQPQPKKKKRGLFGRKKKSSDDGSMSEWLGVDDSYDAKRSGRNIGSWDNFEGKDSWKGGAAGDGTLTEDELRGAVASLGDDELLGHDIWFVATGASEQGNAGIREFLESHRDKLRGVFLINLECVGAGRLAMLSTEGERRVLKGDKRIMGLVSRVSSDFHHEIGAVDMPFVDTDAHAAMEMSLRSLTIAGVDGTNFACSHSQEDMPLNVDTSNIAFAADVVTEVIRRS